MILSTKKNVCRFVIHKLQNVNEVVFQMIVCVCVSGAVCLTTKNEKVHRLLRFERLVKFEILFVQFFLLARSVFTCLMIPSKSFIFISNNSQRIIDSDDYILLFFSSVLNEDNAWVFFKVSSETKLVSSVFFIFYYIFLYF